jgi:hypothetical protein
MRYHPVASAVQGDARAAGGATPDQIHGFVFFDFIHRKQIYRSIPGPAANNTPAASRN